MAIDLYSVRMNQEIKQKLEEMIKESSMSRKDFVENMINQYESYKNSTINLDIQELRNLTMKVKTVYENIDNHITTWQHTVKTNDDIQNLVSNLQEQIKDLKQTIIQKEVELERVTKEKEQEILKLREEYNQKIESYQNDYNKPMHELLKKFNTLKLPVEEVQKKPRIPGTQKPKKDELE